MLLRLSGGYCNELRSNETGTPKPWPSLDLWVGRAGDGVRRDRLARILRYGYCYFAGTNRLTLYRFRCRSPWRKSSGTVSFVRYLGNRFT